ncbi:SGNH/GDSL hydrolase family protein [Amycolatopsis arida]|nr:SGNH/GDSL hydrolase family protein [Amycolatopsis arida]
MAFALPAAAAGAAATPRHYVALGDSYTSGPLIPLQRLGPFGCMRSTSNYPSMLAVALRPRSFTDVSCAGARTEHMFRPQDVTLGRNAPQLDALREGTDLVTLGIGGNDFGVFGRLVGTCPTLRDADPTGAPCREHFTEGGVDAIAALLPGIRDNVAAVLDGIRARAPRAEVLVVGYPRIAPERGHCPDVLPFAEGDYAWLSSVEEALNAALAAATASRIGMSYVDTYGPSNGHDACQPAGVAWVNGKDRTLFQAAEYHPYRAGMAGVASVVRAHLDTRLTAR